MIMRKQIYIILSSICVSGLILFGAGCGKENNSAVVNTNTETVAGKDLPAADALGEDMADIARYPESVRTYYSKSDEETDIIYVTKDEAVEVRDYYKKLLVDLGWTLSGEASDYLDFEKGDSTNPEMFTVYFEWKKKNLWTEYELYYTPPLTAAELEDMQSEE